MKYYVMTLFPEMIQRGMDNSILGKAMEKGLIELETVNIRDYAGNRYLAAAAGWSVKYERHPVTWVPLI